MPSLTLTLRPLASLPSFLKAALLSCLLLSPFMAAVAADAQGAAADGHGTEAVHGLPAGAPVVFDFGVFQITNSMILTWAVALVLIVFAQLATRNIQAIPRGIQNFWEWLVESLHDFLESILGPDLVKKTFWFFATIFLFILTCNWFGLIPGVGSIGWGHPDATGHLHHLSQPLLRGVNADLNMTLAMAIVFSFFWLYWALGANGPGGFINHIFGAKGDTAGLLKVLMVVVFALVGVLEVVSILFRPVSLSFRLYGNIFAGENMIETMAALGGNAFGWLLLLPFYFLELLVGLVQALVFTLLTAVFTLLICQHDEEHGHGHAHGADHAPAKH